MCVYIYIYQYAYTYYNTQHILQLPRRTCARSSWLTWASSSRASSATRLLVNVVACNVMLLRTKILLGLIHIIIIVIILLIETSSIVIEYCDKASDDEVYSRSTASAVEHVQRVMILVMIETIIMIMIMIMII